jgi:hypothetical protein
MISGFSESKNEISWNSLQYYIAELLHNLGHQIDWPVWRVFSVTSCSNIVLQLHLIIVIFDDGLGGAYNFPDSLALAIFKERGSDDFAVLRDHLDEFRDHIVHVMVRPSRRVASAWW